MGHTVTIMHAPMCMKIHIYILAWTDGANNAIDTDDTNNANITNYTNYTNDLSD